MSTGFFHPRSCPRAEGYLVVGVTWGCCDLNRGRDLKDNTSSCNIIEANEFEKSFAQLADVSDFETFHDA